MKTDKRITKEWKIIRVLREQLTAYENGQDWKVWLSVAEISRKANLSKCGELYNLISDMAGEGVILVEELPIESPLSSVRWVVAHIDAYDVPVQLELL